MPATSQTSTTNGHGNVVIQIVGEGNAVSIAGARGLCLTSYESAPFAQAPVDPTRAGQPGWTQSGRRETRILYPYNRASLPFRGREDIVGALKDWLREGVGVSVHALIGGGGRGKTRLAVEIAAWAREQGWTAGFARHEDLSVFGTDGCRTQWNAPCLVVIDYASAKRVEIAAWLKALVHNEAERPPLRLLLLERTGGDGIAWWREIFGQADATGEAVAELLAQGAPTTLEALATPEERHAVFAAAFEQASGKAAPEPSDALDRALSAASLGGEPLFLAMFGLIAARQGLPEARALRADEIATDLAKQELLRIGRIWTARGLPVGADRKLHEHFATAAVLSEGLSEAETHAMIARDSAALRQAIPEDATEPARAALHEALPGEDDGIAPILPDIVGEAAAILTLEGLPDGGVAMIRRLSEAKRQAVAASVIRACQDFLVRGRRAPLAWLEVLRADAADIGTIAELSNAMPHDTTELREIALDLAEELLTLAREMQGDAGATVQATALNNLSNRLYALGRREDALAAIEEAVQIHRALAAAQPDAFVPGLAMSLNNLSGRLSDLGRSEEALTASEEAVQAYRALATANPTDSIPGLAGALNNLSNRLSDLGRREEAVAAIEEAVGIFRNLTDTRRDAFTPDLALTLNNLSGRLSNLGRHEEALAASKEAVKLRRLLAAARPDAFAPNLAGALLNLSNYLFDLGHREEALAAGEEAVQIRRPLAAARPDAFAPDLAASLNNLSIHFSELGRREDALAAIAEAVQVYRHLAVGRPDAFVPVLAMALNNLSNSLSDLGRRESALAAVEESVEMDRALAAARPDAFAPNLAGSLNNLSNHLSNLGRREDALAASAEAVQIRRGLAAARPDAFADALATSLWVLADRLDETGDPEAGIQANREAIAMLAPIFARHVAALAPKMADVSKKYSERCKRARAKPDMDLLDPIAELLKTAAQRAKE